MSPRWRIRTSSLNENRRERKCIWPPCAAERHLDDALHVLLQCPHFAAHRPTYLQRVNVALGSIGHSLADLGTATRQTSFLLGSLVTPFLTIEEDHPGIYQEVLTATATFLRVVYSFRWKYRRGPQGPGPQGPK